MPLMAAYKHVPKLPEMGPEDPGPFALPTKTAFVAFSPRPDFQIALERHDLPLDVAAGRGLDVAVKTAVEIGPVSRALEGHSPETAAAVAATIRDALAPHLKDNKVPLGASIWIVTAVNP